MEAANTSRKMVTLHHFSQHHFEKNRKLSIQRREKLELKIFNYHNS
jgi:hypothetical protein